MKDRRGEGRTGMGDRRVIERFSDSRVHSNYQHIRYWVRHLLILSGVAAVSQIIYGALNGPKYLTISLVVVTVIGIVSGFLWQYLKHINIYLENESVNNHEAMVDKQLNLWKALGIFAIILTVIHLVSFFN